MKIAIEYKENKLKVYDNENETAEWFDLHQIKDMLKNEEIMGVTLDEECNKIYTLNGLKINLAYNYSHKFTIIDKFMFIILLPGEKWGLTFSSEIKKTTVAVFDLEAENFSKIQYPCGQYIASYYIDTLLKHKDGCALQFDAGVDEWKISARDAKELKAFLEYQMCKKE